MAFYDLAWYLNYGDGSTTGYYAVAKRPQNTAVVAGQLCRQFTAPSAGSERVFVCIVAGTTANTTDATWSTGRGLKTTDGTATWQECTGVSAVNGDLTNTVNWTAAKAIGTPTLGAIIKRNSGASYQICTTAGTMAASEPSFSDTAGTTTTDGTSVWTSLGVVGNFTGGQAPHVRLSTALTSGFASGNTIYVGDNHAEVIAPPGSGGNVSGSSTLMAKILCHNHSGPYPPAAGDLTTGAFISENSGNSFNFSLQGSFYFYGITLRAGGGLLFIGPSAVGQVQNWYYFDACQIELTGVAANGLQLGGINVSTWQVIVFNNTKVKFSDTRELISTCFLQFTWQNTNPILASGSQIPTTLFQVPAATAGRFYNLTLEGLDLSQLTGSLFSNAGNSSIGSLVVQDCKLNAAMTITPPGNTGMQVQLNRCDSAATAYKSTRYAYEGTETTETSITRVGGAVDPNGQAQSRKIVTTANAQWLRPFQAEPYAIWNAVTGTNVTVTVYGTVNAGALPFNDDIWIEVEYLGSSATPMGTIVTTTKANLFATNAAVSSDGSSWNGGGSGAGWLPFKLTTTLSSPQPGMAGYMNVRIRAAKASTTYYIDPKIELT